jgi:acyl-coenzyme A thioesterase PaaI-like protein
VDDVSDADNSRLLGEAAPDVGVIRAWAEPGPGRLFGRGHPAGDFLEAYDWQLLERRDGYLHLDCHVPAHVRNPRGQLFGGFTPTYVDLVALATAFAGAAQVPRPAWLATTSMSVDYFEPVVGPRFTIVSQREKQRGRTIFVTTRFFQGPELAVYAFTTMRAVALDRPLGDA